MYHDISIKKKKPLRFSCLATISTHLLPSLQAFRALLICIHLLDIIILAFPHIEHLKLSSELKSLCR